MNDTGLRLTMSISSEESDIPIEKFVEYINEVSAFAQMRMDEYMDDLRIEKEDLIGFVVESPEEVVPQKSNKRRRKRPR